MNKIKIYTYKILIHPLSMMAASILVIILVRSVIYPTVIYAEETNTGYLLVPDIKLDINGEMCLDDTEKNTILKIAFVTACLIILSYILVTGDSFTYFATPKKILLTMPDDTFIISDLSQKILAAYDELPVTPEP